MPRRRAQYLTGVLVIVVAGAAAVALGIRQAGPSPSTPASTGRAASDRSDRWPVTECGTADGRGCAPTTRRVDVDRPAFTRPTEITNPLFPVSRVGSVIQVGRVEGQPFRSETTVLPRTGVVDWYGQRVPVVLSQYTAYLDGDLTEVAIDRYAQADDGSVWYFGEDVIDYRHGAAYLTEGTWLAGRDGPPAMVMPAHPALGDVWRVENVIGIVFEELTVVEVDKTVRGPHGAVAGAIVVDELGVDGGHSRKTLAPGYGEFLTRGGGEVEAMALAVPTDSIAGGVPLALRRALTAAWGTLEYARARDWPTVARSVERIDRAVRAVDATEQPPRVRRLVQSSLAALQRAAQAHRSVAAQGEAVRLAESLLDLEARYLPPQTIEVERFHLHTQRLRVDAAAGQATRVRGDVATLEWIRDRLVLPADADARVDEELGQLRTASDLGSLAAAADIATRLASRVRDAGAVPATDE